ncbi:Transcriptional repressor XBP1 AltName: Full=XhoI site-binding protein 1 [Rhizoctonia solani AG-1 IB]|uniref:XBP1 protein n=1 Tax=Thanatephorus cucumeris (strain AG1-IB / isolate 7/3/14) TaxID=1108050 RepID=M5BPE3_THACB|nr:Transcriptional repressor XBP1 AltName: Full=XhoI site-binding protein 1 [Rhizoctonia solani AG-1 IB]
MSPAIPAPPLPRSGPPSNMAPESSSTFQPQRYQPYSTLQHRITKGRYITSNDPRGYVPVYEYPLNGQWIMMDVDDGYVLWTGIWKALGNTKADIVKMLESQPDLAPQLRRVRGGYLKIQGTWMPFEVALRLARRVAWPIREDLVPLFGPTFPSTCLSPDQPGYGQVVATSGKRKSRRTVQPPTLPVHNPTNPPRSLAYHPEPQMYAQPQVPRRISGEISEAGKHRITLMLIPRGLNPVTRKAVVPPSVIDIRKTLGIRHTLRLIFSRGAIMPGPVSHMHLKQLNTTILHLLILCIIVPQTPIFAALTTPYERLTLPPISALAPNLPSPRGAFTLPPLVAPSVGAPRAGTSGSDIPVLGRMRMNSADDSDDVPRPPPEAYFQQRRSSSAPPLHLAPSRYQPPVRSEDNRRDSHDTRPSWSFRSSDRGSGEYDRRSRPDTHRSDNFAWSSVRGGPATSPPPSASNSTHGELSTNEHSPVSPRTPYGSAWESRINGHHVSGASVRRFSGQYERPSRDPSRSPEIFPRDSDDGRRSPLDMIDRDRSPISHSRKSSGHASVKMDSVPVARAPLRPW